MTNRIFTHGRKPIPVQWSAEDEADAQRDAFFHARVFEYMQARLFKSFQWKTSEQSSDDGPGSLVVTVMPDPQVITSITTDDLR